MYCHVLHVYPSMSRNTVYYICIKYHACITCVSSMYHVHRLSPRVPERDTRQVHENTSYHSSRMSHTTSHLTIHNTPNDTCMIHVSQSAAAIHVSYNVLHDISCPLEGVETVLRSTNTIHVLLMYHQCIVRVSQRRRPAYVQYIPNTLYHIRAVSCQHV